MERNAMTEALYQAAIQQLKADRDAHRPLWVAQELAKIRVLADALERKAAA